MRAISAVTVLAVVLAVPLTGQTPELELRGTAGAVHVLGLDELQGLDLREVTVDENGPATYRGPLLRDLATMAGAPTGRTLRGPAMALALRAEGADGYAVAFTVPEVDEQFGATTAIVALTRNGDEIAGEDGPLRLVVPDDGFHARWVRGLVRISLVDLGAATPGPEAR